MLSLATISDHIEEKTTTAATHTLSCIKFSADGSLVATCSERGTLIRVFDTDTASLVMEFRRGTRPAHITAMAFSPSSGHLGVASSNGTLHIFDLGDAVGEHARQRATITWKPVGYTYSDICFVKEDRIAAVTESKSELDYLTLDYITSSVALEKSISLDKV